MCTKVPDVQQQQPLRRSAGAGRAREHRDLRRGGRAGWALASASAHCWAVAQPSLQAARLGWGVLWRCPRFLFLQFPGPVGQSVPVPA